METAFGYNEIQYVFDTWQFTDYNKYQANMFDPEKKRARLQEQFPRDLAAAKAMGVRLTARAMEIKKENS